MSDKRQKKHGVNAARQERRAHVRFEVPGTSLDYRCRSFLRRGFSEELCPVENISRGGLMMLCRRPLKPGHRLSLRLSFENDDLAFEWRGRVAWIYPVQAADFAFSAGVQFDPAEGRAGSNAAAFCAALDALQKKYGRG
jgi:hypothetical protein